MASEDDVPQTFEEALRSGGREATPEQFRSFIESLDEALIERNLVDCTRPENEGKLCFQTGCYKGQRAFRYCQNRLCQRTVFKNC